MTARRDDAKERLQSLGEALRPHRATLSLPEGLPNRPWYRHAIYAPGQYTGYAAVVIPGVNGKGVRLVVNDVVSGHFRWEQLAEQLPDYLQAQHVVIAPPATSPRSSWTASLISVLFERGSTRNV